MSEIYYYSLEKYFFFKHVAVVAVMALGCNGKALAVAIENRSSGRRRLAL